MELLLFEERGEDPLVDALDSVVGHYRFAAASTCDADEGAGARRRIIFFGGRGCASLCAEVGEARDARVE